MLGLESRSVKEHMPRRLRVWSPAPKGGKIYIYIYSYYLLNKYFFSACHMPGSAKYVLCVESMLYVLEATLIVLSLMVRCNFPIIFTDGSQRLWVNDSIEYRSMMKFHRRMENSGQMLSSVSGECIGFQCPLWNAVGVAPVSAMFYSCELGQIVPLPQASVSSCIKWKPW